MTYSFYLFVNLRNLILGEGSEYDLQFGIDQNLFSIYEKSAYNEENLPEYECIVNFLQAYKDGKFKTTSDIDGNILSNRDWVVLLEPRSIEHPIITPKKGDILQFVRTNDEESTLGEFLHLPSNHNLVIFADRTLKLNK